MKNWKNIILDQSSTMHDAISLLNNEALGIVLVVNSNQKLIGTITDGDIRRALLRHLDMNTPVIDFMYGSPKVAGANDSKSQLLLSMQKFNLLHIPIVNSSNRIVGLETMPHLLEKNVLDNPVFLMAGGFGQRLMPLTKNTPKPMLNVGSKPILETILDKFIDAGFHNFFISLHYKGEIIKEYFGDGSKWGVSICYLNEKEPLGTAGSLGLIPKDKINLPIIMMNGDLITEVNFKELLAFHTKHVGDATMCVQQCDFQVPFGVIESVEHQITSIVEKPTQSLFINAGIYALDPVVLEDIEGDKYIDMPDMLNERIKKDKKVNMFPVHEYWLDIGHIENYEIANEYAKKQNNT
jgi:dTDP-glucose pyrophosphorylase